MQVYEASCAMLARAAWHSDRQSDVSALDPALAPPHVLPPVSPTNGAVLVDALRGQAAAWNLLMASAAADIKRNLTTCVCTV